MADSNIEIKITLDNGQYKNAVDDVRKKTDGLEKNYRKNVNAMDNVGKTFSQKMRRYFSLGALFGGAFLTAYRAISALFNAIGKGLNNAINNNKALKASLEDMMINFELLFNRIGEMLTPIIERLIDVGNFVANLLGKSQSAGMSRETLQSYAQALRWNIANKTGDAKQTQLWVAALAEVEAKLKIIKKIDDARAKTIKDDLNKALEEQIAIIKTLGDKLLGLFPTGEATEFAAQLSEVVGLLNKMPKDDKGGFDLGNAFKNIMESGDWITMAIKAVGSLVQLGADLVNQTNATRAAQMQAAEDLRYKNYLEDLNREVAKLTHQLVILEFIVSKEEIIRNKTADDIMREIDAKEDLYDVNEKLIKQGEDAAKATGFETKEQFDAEAARLTGLQGEAEQSAAWWRQQLTNLYFDGNGQLQFHSWDYDRLATSYKDAAAQYTAWGDAFGKGQTAELENLGLINDLEDLNLELTEMRLDAEKAITDEIEKQKDLMRDLVGLGLDLENIRVIKQLTGKFQGMGLQGVELGAALTDVGVRSSAIGGKVLNIYGDINNTLNQATPNALIANMNSLINQIGGV